ncbi:hypothetical protein CU098_007186, partial [Rhizopus stolonifer]
RQRSTRKLCRTVTEKEIDFEITSDTPPIASQQLMEVDDDPAGRQLNNLKKHHRRYQVNGFLKSSRNKPSLVKPEIKNTEKSTTMADDSETKSRKITQQAEVSALLGSIQILKLKRKKLFLENSIQDLKRK